MQDCGGSLEVHRADPSYQLRVSEDLHWLIPVWAVGQRLRIAAVLIRNFERTGNDFTTVPAVWRVCTSIRSLLPFWRAT